MAGESKIKTALSNLGQTIAEKISDAASLDVVTLSGDFVLTVSDVVGTGQKKFDIDNVMTKLTANANANLNLVAYTSIKIDGDQTNIVKDNLSEEQKELVKFHREMIEAGINSRKAIVDLIKSFA